MTTYKKTVNQDSQEFRKAIKSYGMDTPFGQAIYGACGFSRFFGKQITLLDAMAGPGKLGKGIEKIYNERKPNAAELKVVFNDSLHERVEQLRGEGYHAIGCDIRSLHTESDVLFNVVAVRYGIKDLTEGEAQGAIESIRDTIRKGGRLVIGDMTAFSREGQKGVNIIHTEKKIYEGRDVKSEGPVYIPQVGEWHDMLGKAGFKARKLRSDFTSEVETSQWAGQFGQGADDKRIISELNKLILFTCKQNGQFKREFRVKEEDGKVFISFPIMVAYGIKE